MKKFTHTHTSLPESYPEKLEFGDFSDDHSPVSSSSRAGNWDPGGLAGTHPERRSSTILAVHAEGKNVRKEALGGRGLGSRHLHKVGMSLQLPP